MSRNYYLTCPQTKQYVWIGQGSIGSDIMDTFYSSEPTTIKLLHLFLNHTKGKKLILLDEHTLEYNYQDYAEIAAAEAL